MDYPWKILDRSVPRFDRRFAKDIQLTCVTLCCVDNIPFTKQKLTKHKKKNLTTNFKCGQNQSIIILKTRYVQQQSFKNVHVCVKQFKDKFYQDQCVSTNLDQELSKDLQNLEILSKSLIIQSETARDSLLTSIRAIDRNLIQTPLPVL